MPQHTADFEVTEVLGQRVIVTPGRTFQGHGTGYFLGVIPVGMDLMLSEEDKYEEYYETVTSENLKSFVHQIPIRGFMVTGGRAMFKGTYKSQQQPKIISQLLTTDFPLPYGATYKTDMEFNGLKLLGVWPKSWDPVTCTGELSIDEVNPV